VILLKIFVVIAVGGLAGGARTFGILLPDLDGVTALLELLCEGLRCINGAAVADGGVSLAIDNHVFHGVVLSGLSACGVVVIAFDGLIIRHFHDAVKQAKSTIIAMTFCAVLSWT
jgi:hypothetical protein